MELTDAVRSKGYLTLLVFGALVGVPISLAALAFVTLVHHMETWIWSDLPSAMGMAVAPWWLYLAIPAIGGIAVAIVRKLPGDGGHHPLQGFGGTPIGPKQLPSVLLAAFFTLSAGIVLGPEAPLVGLGTGLAAFFGAKAVKSNPQAGALIGLCGAFASVAAIFGNPLAAAILLIEALGLGGSMLTIALLPGLLSAGVGYLVFTGVGDWWPAIKAPTLTLPALPSGGSIYLPDILWAIVVGFVAAALMMALRRGASQIEKLAKKVSPMVMLPVAGLIVGLCCIGYAAWTGKPGQDILFSGQTGVGVLAADASAATLGTLIALAIFKSLAYGVSLGSGFRGGPIFPSLFIGAVLGLIASMVLPGLSPLAGFASGMAAATAAMMRLPLASLVIVALLLGPMGLSVMPIMIIAVVVGVCVRGFSEGREKHNQKLETPTAATAAT